MAKYKHTVALIGNGPVACILAIALKQNGIDFIWYGNTSNSLSGMCYALHPKYIDYLQTLDIKPRNNPIYQMHLKHQTHPLEINHKYGDYRSLCEVIKHIDLADAYERRLLDLELHPQSYQNIGVTESSLVIDDHDISAKYILAADGFHSPIHRMLGLSYTKHDPDQVAHIGIMTHYEKLNYAYQAFRPEGTFALLPIRSHQSNLIWCTDYTMQSKINDIGFQNAINIPLEATGLRMTQLDHHYQIKILCKQSSVFYHQNIAFVGTALHAIHPIAGLGLNLSIGDIIALISIIIHEHPLCRYASKRTPAHQYASYLCHIAANSRHHTRLSQALSKTFASFNNPLAQRLIIKMASELC